jgi:endo-1,4-beta-xylanase
VHKGAAHLTNAAHLTKPAPVAPDRAEGRPGTAAPAARGGYERIRTPLFIAQGARDPRVNKAESDQMVEALKKRGVPVHGLGIQAHVAVDGPSIADIEQSILAFAELGLRVHFTELDVDVLPQVWNLPVAEISTRFEYRPERDPFKDGLTQEMNDKLSSRYEDLFKLFIKHKDKIDRVTLWGVSDDASWLNGFPIRGRTAYPLLFDRKHQPKDAYQRVLAL